MAQGAVRVAAEPAQGSATVGQQEKPMAMEMGRQGPFIDTHGTAMLPEPPGHGQPAGAASHHSCMEHG